MVDGKQRQRNTLLNWYEANRRVLPWREDPSAYHVWISEIMLQQTRVEAVLGYYERFLQALPDIPTLAAAPEDQCLKLWQGLGYYSRVRNLRKAAEIVVSEYGGVLPPEPEKLRKLPGIGRYTAAAIASISFGKRIPAVDGTCCGFGHGRPLMRETFPRTRRFGKRSNSTCRFCQRKIRGTQIRR